jgi:hypothetical protein
MSADLVVYNQSVEEAPSSSVMTDKKWLQVLDQNNGSYSVRSIHIRNHKFIHQ